MQFTIAAMLSCGIVGDHNGLHSNTSELAASHFYCHGTIGYPLMDDHTEFDIFIAR